MLPEESKVTSFERRLDKKVEHSSGVEPVVLRTMRRGAQYIDKFFLGREVLLSGQLKDRVPDFQSWQSLFPLRI